MAPQAQQQSGQQDSGLGPLWVIAALFIFGMLLWYYYHPQLVALYFQIKLLELQFLSLFTSEYNQIIAWIKNMPTEQVSAAQVGEVADVVGRGLMVSVIALLAWFAVVLFFSNVTGRFKTTYNMETLLEAEKDEWPTITPVAKLNLVDTPLDKGPWAMALQPMQFAKKHKLLRVEKNPGRKYVIASAPPLIASVVRSRANRVFVGQLGYRWVGVERVPIHIQALFAICAARACDDEKAANELMDQIAASTETGRLDFSGTKALLKKYKDNKKIKKICNKHAYVTGVMASMLLLARGTGVLATASFLWLKPVDRLMWYMLNSIGRYTPYCEVAGAYAHWKSEMEFGRKLTIPMVEEATNALEKAIKDIIYKPDDEE